MITTKQRAYLRVLANGLDSIFQVGKNGLEPAFYKQVSEALEKRELIKITVLENAQLTAKDVSRSLCQELGCDGVQVIGRKVVVYRPSENPENRRISLPQ
ncbi:RNA binding protein [Clostridiaceae bacterium JG1575]|nr:RNA binding protein [Clostridiaceae bacterium JG1575]